MPLLEPLRLRLITLLALMTLFAPPGLFAISCTMQGQMTDDQRNDLLESARKIALAMQSGDAAAVRAMTVAKVAAQFDPIANSIQRVEPMISTASITIDAMYDLDASDLTAGQGQAQFFCATPDGGLHEEITISGLPPGKYGFTLVHATGVRQPQQMGLLLEKSGQWELAGFFVKPLLVAGHDSVWYWSRARAFAQKGQKWNAHFYYQTAAYLAAPVGFMNTPNLERLVTEQEAVKAEGLPGQQPISLMVDGRSVSITDVHTDDSLGGLDLMVRYVAADTSNPVTTRADILDLMKALLSQHPELRDGFHGLWVFAEAPSQRPFGIELPMSEIH